MLDNKSVPNSLLCIFTLSLLPLSAAEERSIEIPFRHDLQAYMCITTRNGYISYKDNGRGNSTPHIPIIEKNFVIKQKDGTISQQMTRQIAKINRQMAKFSHKEIPLKAITQVINNQTYGILQVGPVLENNNTPSFKYYAALTRNNKCVPRKLYNTKEFEFYAQGCFFVPVCITLLNNEYTEKSFLDDLEEKKAEFSKKPKLWSPNIISRKYWNTQLDLAGEQNKIDAYEDDENKDSPLDIEHGDRGFGNAETWKQFEKGLIKYDGVTHVLHQRSLTGTMNGRNSLNQKSLSEKRHKQRQNNIRALFLDPCRNDDFVDEETIGKENI